MNLPFLSPSGPRDTLFTALVSACRRFGKDDIDQWQDQTPASYRYRDVLDMTLVLGRLMARNSVEGEHIGVLMPNVASTMALVIGLSAFRRVPCMLNYTAGTEGMQNACRVAGAVKVVTSRQFLQKAGLEEVARGVKGVDLLFLEDLKATFSWRDKVWLLAFARHRPLSVVPAGETEAPALVLYTSGSEGKPKGVVLSHRALLTNVAQILDYLPFTPQEKVFNCLPIFHSFGFTAGTLLPLLSGAKLVLYPNPLHFKEIPRLISETGATVLFGSSTFLSHYGRNAGPDDLKTLRYVVAGAEKLAEPVRTLWREKYGVDILEGYGATETAPVLSVNRPDNNHPGTVGALLPGIEARIVPVEGITQGGALHVRGPNLLSGYYHPERPGELQPPWSSLGEGWYNMGDVAEIDADGFISIRGRLRRFAKIAGEMVSLEIVEAMARAASPDGMHAATCMPDSHRGEAIILFTTDALLTRERLLASAHVLGYPEVALPRKIHVVEVLPVLGTGKLNYPRLKEMAQEKA